MNETLSSSQAKVLVAMATEICETCVVKMEGKSEEFVRKVSQIWEDNNVVEFAKKYRKAMEDIINQLGDNNRVLADTVEGIANDYAKVGNMPHVSVDKVKLSGVITIDPIKPQFEDGNGDDFGFKNPRNGVEQVMEAFETLTSELTKISCEAVTRINKINAFGNAEVQMCLAKSAAKILDIFNQQIAEAEAILREYLEKTAQAYAFVGDNALHAAKLGVGTGGGTTPSGPVQ